ncbi:hypothetical protein [Plantibacter sp. RU18]
MFGNDVAIGILIMYVVIAAAVIVGITLLVQYIQRRRTRHNPDMKSQDRL